MTMPAGRYYVGDLCYVMHEVWDEVCGLFFHGRNDHGCNEGEFNLKDGRRFVSFNTKYGDGQYYDNMGNAYGVDAGLIGCISVFDIDGFCTENGTSGGNIIDFKEPFDCYGGRGSQGRDWDGIIRIGHVEIDTEGDTYSREDEELYEEEE